MQMTSVEAGSMMTWIGNVSVCVHGDDLICLPVTGVFICENKPEYASDDHTGRFVVYHLVPCIQPRP